MLNYLLHLLPNLHRPTDGKNGRARAYELYLTVFIFAHACTGGAEW